MGLGKGQLRGWCWAQLPLAGQGAAPCFQQSCVLCTAAAKPHAGPWLSSRSHPQHRNAVLELPAEADLAAVALRLARGAGLCQVAASLREEMAFHEPRFCFCMELCPGRLGQPEVVLIILPSSLTWSPPAPLGVCGQAVPCGPAEQLVCPGGARQKAGVLRAPTSTPQSSGALHREGPGCAGATGSSCCLQSFCLGTGAGLSLLPAQGTAL